MSFGRDNPFNDSIRIFTDPRVDDPDPPEYALRLSPCSCFPAVEYKGDVVAFLFPVKDERVNEFLPLLFQVIVACADEVVSVYDQKRDGVLLWSALPAVRSARHGILLH